MLKPRCIYSFYLTDTRWFNIVWVTTLFHILFWKPTFCKNWNHFYDFKIVQHHFLQLFIRIISPIISNSWIWGTWSLLFCSVCIVHWSCCSITHCYIRCWKKIIIYNNINIIILLYIIVYYYIIVWTISHVYYFSFISNLECGIILWERVECLKTFLKTWYGDWWISRGFQKKYQYWHQYLKA